MNKNEISNQSVMGCEVGNKVGMNREVIPTSLPGSNPEVGTAVPTSSAVLLPSRAELKQRQPSTLSCVLSLLILLAGTALVIHIHMDFQKHRERIRAIHAQNEETLERIRETTRHICETKREIGETIDRICEPTNNFLPPTPENDVKP